LRMTIQMNYLAIIEEITAYGHLIRMAIIPKFTLTPICVPIQYSFQISIKLCDNHALSQRATP